MKIKPMIKYQVSSNPIDILKSFSRIERQELVIHFWQTKDKKRIGAKAIVKQIDELQGEITLEPTGYRDLSIALRMSIDHEMYFRDELNCVIFKLEQKQYKITSSGLVISIPKNVHLKES